MSRLVTSRLLRAPLLCAALTLPACPARADRAPDAEWALRDAVDGAARDPHLLVVIDNARGAKGTPMGAAIAGIADQILAQGRAERAWADFAQRLGWTTAQAFDEIFGTRVMLVMRGLDQPEPQWALLGDVSAEAERRLRERLDVAPRNLVRGHAVMSVERGEYELTSERAGDRAVLLFAPAVQPSLLDDLLPLLGKDGGGRLLMGREKPGADAAAPPRLLLTFRAPDNPRNTVGLVGVATAAEFRGRIIVEGPQAQCAGVVPPPYAAEAAWRRLITDDTLCAVSLAQGAPGAPRADPSLPMWAEGRVIDFAPEHSGLIGRNVALVLRRGAEAVFSVAGAAELTDARAAAPLGDALMARMLQGLGVEGQDFGGVAPEADRVSSLGVASIGTMRAIQGATVRWSFLVAPGQPGAAASRGGWWVAGSEGSAYVDLRKSLTDPAPHDPDAPISRGLIRPSAMLDAIGGFNLPLPRVAGAVAPIETVEWWMRREADERMSGEMLVRVAAPAVPSGAPGAPDERRDAAASSGPR